MSPKRAPPAITSSHLLQSAMARTRGAKSSSPSGRKRSARETPIQGSISEPPRPLVVPLPVTNTSLSHPSSSEPPSEPQPSQPPPTESQILAGMTPEALARAQGLIPSAAEPQLERKRIYREIFTLNKWMSMTAYSTEPGAPVGAEHPDIPQLEEPIPEVAPSAPPATPQTPPVFPATSEPPSSSEPRIAISMSEYRGLCHTLQTLTTSESILTQQMSALPSEHPTPIISKPTEHTMPSEEPTIGDAETST
ncbi:hypothetical protein CK203_044648 [Vitis vinifera]|uniref:Uncharacterized protein n=1 Tax=Vitis vinifera TaxID=29760 RepID=A0A438HJK9_VITVI|nr:hypothetical protein CK203_044648 [Vitis vinifera]